ncbi:MAG: cobalt ECF transporter T component CbiQ [Treponema sp.]|jgi:cobalt/nickel transport system permease protein|nr:cobalt ECF transporter T component CbiQ [Treponema sp.]
MSLGSALTGIDHLERLALGTSPVHRLHPRAKLLTTIAYIITVISFPSWNVSGLVPFLFYPAILMSLSGTPYKPLLTRLLGALPFSLMGGLSNLVLLRGTAFSLGFLTVSLGMVSFVSIMLKTLLTVFAVLILIATTSFIEISRQLSALGMPKILSLQLVMTYRYLSVLIGEAVSMFTAYILRSGGQKGIRMQDMGSFLGQLILRSFDRAERVYQAMKCRGFEGAYRGRASAGFSASDYGYTLALIALMIFFRFFNLSVFAGNLLQGR